MADHVSSKASALLNVLETISFQEIAMAFRLKDDVEKLKSSMKSITPFLLDAENKHAHERSITVWLKQFSKIFDDAKDIWDEIEYEAKRDEVVKRQSSSRTKICQFFSCFSNPFAFRIKMARKIKYIILKMDELISDGRKFGLTELVVNDPTLDNQLWRVTGPLLDLHVLGNSRLEEKEEIINSLLMGQQSDANNVDVISIVGFGGLGKTTLAQMIYDDDRVKQHFNMLMWVCVSEDFDARRLIQRIIHAASKTKNVVDANSSLQHMVSLLNEKLRGKKFLLVLDDVWNENYNKWDELSNHLLKAGSDRKSKGSKIIVTTRSHKVANIVESGLLINLKALFEDECWKLFVKCAFHEEKEAEEYPRLKQIGVEIVQKCKGVPLAITTLGYLLRSKSCDEIEWRKINDSEVWKLDSQENGILPSLKLSYNHLPAEVKQCFSYCSCFPKDYKYQVIELIMFWMAHGLLQSTREEEDAEDIGELYVTKLVSKFLLEIEDNSHSYFDFQNLRSKTLKMHDMMHDLAQVTMEESDKTRTVVVLPWLQEASAELDWASEKFNFLKALHLEEMKLMFLPNNCFANMKHLRYLNLRGCLLEKLPNSICTLQNLQFLNLHRCFKLQELPKSMENLISLQVLLLTVNAINLSSVNIGRFQQLQTLFLLDCMNLVSLPGAIGCLSALKKLVIHGCDELMNFEDENQEEKQQVKGYHLNLKVLEIVGSHKLKALPNWLQRAGELQSLRIAGTMIKSFPEWFPVSSSLERLDICSCPKLSSLPMAMDRLLHRLQHLEIVDCPKLWARYNKLTGPDAHKINHVPHCKVYYYY